MEDTSCNEPYGITIYCSIIRDGSDLNPDSDSNYLDSFNILILWQGMDFMDVCGSYEYWRNRSSNRNSLELESEWNRAHFFTGGTGIWIESSLNIQGWNWNRNWIEGFWPGIGNESELTFAGIAHHPDHWYIPSVCEGCKGKLLQDSVTEASI